MRISTSSTYVDGIVEPIPPWLSVNDVKCYHYGQESYFQECYADWMEACGKPQQLKRYSYVLLKPDAFPPRTITGLVQAAEDRGFFPVCAKRLRLDRLTIRELWRYELNLASLSRYPLIDRLLCVGDSLFLLLWDKAGTEEDASERLSKLKGASTLALRSPASLRSAIRAGNGTLNHIHSPDSSIDLLREIGVLFDAQKRKSLLRAIVEHSATGELQDRERVNAEISSLCQEYTAHRLDYEEVVRRRPGIADELLAGRDERCESERVAAFLTGAEPGSADFWDRMTIVNKLIPVSVPGVVRILDFECVIR